MIVMFDFYINFIKAVTPMETMMNVPAEYPDAVTVRSKSFFLFYSRIIFKRSMNSENDVLKASAAVFKREKYIKNHKYEINSDNIYIYIYIYIYI